MSRENSVRFLISIAQHLHMNLGLGKLDNFMMRKCSTYSMYYIILQTGPEVTPHNETLGCFFRKMCAYSHCVGLHKDYV